MPDDRTPPAAPPAEPVLQVERRDYVELAPDGPAARPADARLRPRSTPTSSTTSSAAPTASGTSATSGLIYTHYTHNCVVYTADGQRLQPRGRGARHHPAPRELPRAARHGHPGDLARRRGRGVLHLPPRHRLGPAHPGRPSRPADRPDLRVAHHRRLHDPSRTRSTASGSSPTRWRSSCSSALDADAFAARPRGRRFDQGLLVARHRREPPAARASTRPRPRPTSRIAHTDLEAETLRLLHEVFNRRMFGRITDVYAPNCQYHGPLMTRALRRRPPSPTRRWA